MKVKALRQMLVNGKEVLPGDVVEVKEFDGNYLVCRKFAELVEETEEKPAPAPKKAKAKK